MRERNLFKYENDLVLTSLGGISEPLVHDVKNILEKHLGFGGPIKGLEHILGRIPFYPEVMEVLTDEPKDIMPFFDSEPRYRIPENRLEKYRGKHVVIVEYLKVFDNRLLFAFEKLVNEIDGLASDYQRHLNTGGRRLPWLEQRIENLNKLIGTDVCDKNTLRYHIEPNFKDKIGARNSSSRLNPNTVFMQLQGQIRSLRKAGARHISVALPKTIYEWSHHFEQNLALKKRYELFSYKIFIDDIVEKGANSLLIQHPHAPIEGLELSNIRKLNYVALYPQSQIISTNGIDVPVSSFFSRYNIESDPMFNPARMILEDAIESLGRRKGIKDLMIYISSPDNGSYKNARAVADLYGLNCVRSLSDRENEGVKSVLHSDDLEKYLLKLRDKTSEGNIKVFVFDDMLNTGGTADNEARLRKKQIDDFNRKYGTHYKADLELVVTHMRFPYINYIEHKHFNKVHVFDSVPYLPPLEEQITDLGLHDKFNIISATAYQLALLIKFNYHLDLWHHNRFRKLDMSSYRSDHWEKNFLLDHGFDAWHGNNY